MTRRLGLLGGGLIVTGAVLSIAGSAIAGAGPRGQSAAMMGGGMMGGGMMGGGMMGGGMMGGGMMGGGMMGARPSEPAAGPGEAGFIAGTDEAPRVVRVVAGPGYAFSPSSVLVARGETVTFEVTAMGGLVHSFVLGPADAVAAGGAGTESAVDITMMGTGSVTYTFDGSGSYGFACQTPGHSDAGMRGTITVVG